MNKARDDRLELTLIDVCVSRLESAGFAPGTSGTAPRRTGRADGTGSPEESAAASSAPCSSS